MKTFFCLTVLGAFFSFSAHAVETRAYCKHLTVKQITFNEDCLNNDCSATVEDGDNGNTTKVFKFEMPGGTERHDTLSIPTPQYCKNITTDGKQNVTADDIPAGCTFILKTKMGTRCTCAKPPVGVANLCGNPSPGGGGGTKSKGKTGLDGNPKGG